MTGLVVKSTGSWYAVRIESEGVVECRLKGKIRLDDRKTTNPVAVGDKVDVEKSNDASYQITHIYPRQNYIIRKSINLSKQAHIIASNLSQAILVATIVAPRTSLGFIDRFLVTAEAYGIPAKIVFNKKDALDADMLELQEDMMRLYTNIGYDCFSVSAFNKDDIAFLKTILKDKITLVAGHSGVGKSTLVNAIEPNLDLKTGDISSTHLKGMHTTTFAELFPLSFGGDIIDSPGIKELGLVEMKREEVGQYFKEIELVSHDCKFNNCLHVNEPHCAVIKATHEGTISQERYNSYIGILNGEEMDWKDWKIR